MNRHVVAALVVVSASSALAQVTAGAVGLVYDRELPSPVFGVEFVYAPSQQARYAHLPPSGLVKARLLEAASGERALALEVLKAYGATSSSGFNPAKENDAFVYRVVSDLTDGLGTRRLSLLDRDGNASQLTIEPAAGSCVSSRLSLNYEVSLAAMIGGGTLAQGNHLARTRDSAGQTTNCNLDGSLRPELPLVRPANAISYDLPQQSSWLLRVDLARLSNGRTGVASVSASLRGSQMRPERTAIVLAFDTGWSSLDFVPTNEMEGVFEVVASVQRGTRWVLTAKDRNNRVLSVTFPGGPGIGRPLSATLDDLPLQIE